MWQLNTPDPSCLAVFLQFLSFTLKEMGRGGGVCVYSADTFSLLQPPPLSTWSGSSDTQIVALLENKLWRWLRLRGPIDELQGVGLLGGINGWPIPIIITLPPAYRSPTE